MPVFEPRRPTNRKLFDVPEGSTRSFVLGSWSPDWHLWVAGYKLAADRLVSHLTEHGTRFDYVCIPILFLYRHFVELYLKALLRDVGELLETSEAVQFGQPVWRAGKKVFAQAYCYEQRWRVAFWVGVPAQSLMTADTRYEIPQYIGHNGWIALDVSKSHRESELRPLALGSYRHFALKKMLARL